MAQGGIGVIHRLAKRLGLTKAIDQDLHWLKRHLPYHESDHVLNLAYNIMAGGIRLEDIELRRRDEAWMDALGAKIIPDPTTAGDFLRRFGEEDILTLMDLINDCRLKVWNHQPKVFFKEAILNVDGTIAPTEGECKQGMDISYKESGAIILWYSPWPKPGNRFIWSIDPAMPLPIRKRRSGWIAAWTWSLTGLKRFG
jgi:hypothetical protein